MYTTNNFGTKKALKEALVAYHAGEGPAITYYQPGPFGGNEPQAGTLFLEGPHFPNAHTWYAQATAENGVIIKVK